jgi:hypothetical protein
MAQVVRVPASKNENEALSSNPIAAYNPSYSGGRDQEDQGLKPAQDK